MKLFILILLLCFTCGCASDKRYFKTKNGRGPYIPDYLTFHPVNKTK